MRSKVIYCLLCLGSLAFESRHLPAEDTNLLDSFTSKAAVKAVDEYRKRDEFLVTRLDEERAKELAKLAISLKAAIESATAQGDFAEVGRLSSYLGSQPGIAVDGLPKKKDAENAADDEATKSLKAEVADLRREIARLNSTEPKHQIHGQWMRSDGTVFTFNRDGTFVASPGKPGVSIKDIHKAGYVMQCPGYLFMFYPKEGGRPRYYTVTNETILLRSDKQFTLTRVGK
tara:strand:- start:660 stop:1349 length:690 start_codon:yes stop_codon:yes gene_type:complete